MAEGSQSAWWSGRRGEWYVVGQIALFVLVVLGPRTWREGAGLFSRTSGAMVALGLALVLVGGVLALGAAIRVGTRLTPLPHPVEGAPLHQGGVYRWVRHPMYCGAVLAAVGWALVADGPLTLAYAVLLFVLFDLKSRREEVWLRRAYAGYGEYSHRVRRLIPFVY